MGKYKEKSKQKEGNNSDEVQNQSSMYDEMKNQIEALKAKIDELSKNQNRTFTPKSINNPPFILEKETSFNVWMNVIINDFKSLAFEYMLDETLQAPEISSDEDEQRMGFANSYILSRLNPDYRKIVCNLKTPSEIMNKIKSLKNPSTPSLKFAIKRQWSSANFTKNSESAVDFIVRFEELKRKVESYGDELKDKEVVENFLMAVENSYPELTRRYDASNESLSIDELKTMLINVEEKEKETKARLSEGEALVADTYQKQKGKHPGKTSGKTAVCYRCGKQNHTSSECKNPKRICYNCRQLVTDHQASNCPNATYTGKNKVGFVYKQNSMKRGGFRGRARGRFPQRGRGRGSFTQPGHLQQISRKSTSNDKMYKRVKFSDENGQEKFAFLAVDEEEHGYIAEEPSNEVQEEGMFE